MGESKKEFLNLVLKELLILVWFAFTMKIIHSALKSFGVDDNIAFGITAICGLIWIAVERVVRNKDSDNDDSDGIIEESTESMIENKIYQKGV